MLDRIEMDVIAVPLTIVLVTQCVLPVSPLPNAAFAFGLATLRTSFLWLQCSREFRLD